MIRSALSYYQLTMAREQELIEAFKDGIYSNLSHEE